MTRANIISRFFQQRQLFKNKKERSKYLEKNISRQIILYDITMNYNNFIVLIKSRYLMYPEHNIRNTVCESYNEMRIQLDKDLIKVRDEPDVYFIPDLMESGMPSEYMPPLSSDPENESCCIEHYIVRVSIIGDPIFALQTLIPPPVVTWEYFYVEDNEKFSNRYIEKFSNIPDYMKPYEQWKPNDNKAWKRIPGEVTLPIYIPNKKIVNVLLSFNSKEKQSGELSRIMHKNIPEGIIVLGNAVSYDSNPNIDFILLGIKNNDNVEDPDLLVENAIKSIPFNPGNTGSYTRVNGNWDWDYKNYKDEYHEKDEKEGNNGKNEISGPSNLQPTTHSRWHRYTF